MPLEAELNLGRTDPKNNHFPNMSSQPHKNCIWLLQSFICAFSGKICILIPWPMEYYTATENLRMSDSYVVKWKVSTIRS